MTEALVPEVKSGWGRPENSRRWHYFDADCISLCTYWWGILPNLQETKENILENKEDCIACRKKLSAILARRKVHHD